MPDAMSEDPPIEKELLRSALLLELEVTERLRPGGAEADWIRLRGRFTEFEDVAWGAFPFLYFVTMLSFLEAGPAGSSEIHFREEDGWYAEDVLRALRYESGELRVDTDYVRGRRMKTTVSITPDGTFLVEAHDRMDGAERWIGRLQGERQATIVQQRSRGTAGPES